MTTTQRHRVIVVVHYVQLARFLSLDQVDAHCALLVAMTTTQIPAHRALRVGLASTRRQVPRHALRVQLVRPISTPTQLRHARCALLADIVQLVL